MGSVLAQVPERVPSGFELPPERQIRQQIYTVLERKQIGLIVLIEPDHFRLSSYTPALGTP